MAKTNFYAVYGFNAVGVVVGWSKVQKVQKYIHGFNNKKFTTFQVAERYAIENARNRIPDMYKIPDKLKCGNVLFLKDLEINEEAE